MIPDYIIERAKSKEPFFIDSCIDHLHLYSLQDFERDINFRPALNQKRLQFNEPLPPQKRTWINPFTL